MSKVAWTYVSGVMLASIACIGLTFGTAESLRRSWMLLVVMTIAATLAQLYEAKHNRQSYYPHIVFFMASVLLLPPPLFALVIGIPHFVELVLERFHSKAHQRAWYIQPFNIATHVLAGMAAYVLIGGLAPTWLDTQSLVSASIVFFAAFLYVIVNHLLVGMALFVARGISLRQSSILLMNSLLPDFVMAWLGCVVALLWTINLVWVALALSPLVLMYQALRVPQLKEEAQIDGKTGVFNARHIMTLFTKELEQAQHTGRPLSFIMADLDFLRTINNMYGHLAGDVVLGGIGKIIQQTIRPDDYAGRFGGEEFAILLPNTDRDGALVLAERLRQAIEATPFTIATNATPIHATMSLGIACFPHDAATQVDLLHAADVAVYQAKHQGRNRVVCVADVPPAVRNAPIGDEQGAAHTLPTLPTETFSPAGEIQQSQQPSTNSEPVPSPAAPAPAPAERLHNPGLGRPATLQPLFWMFVSSVIAAGMGVALLGLTMLEALDGTLIVLLTVFALFSEWFQINVYGRNTVSVSVAVVFAAALLTGIPGASAASAGIVLAHSLKRRPRIYRALFNWSTHVLAATLPFIVLQWMQLPLHPMNVLPLAFPIGLAAFAYYLVDTGLIAGAMSLAGGTRIFDTWREQFQWLIVHYLVLCGLGFFASVAYTGFGFIGLWICVLPIFLARYAQKQYIEHTEASMEALQRLNTQLIQANQDVIAANKAIQELNDELFETLARFFDARDPYVGGHAATVADYATAIGQELGITGNRLKYIRQAGFLHDIGKIAIPESILHKSGKLNDDEFAQMKTHAVRGAELVAQSHGLRHLAPFIRYHHERWDGKGYPEGLSGEDIPLEARILNVSDSVEAMASDRPYHAGMTLPEVLAEVKRCAGTQFDPQVADAFLHVVEKAGAAFVINSAREIDRRQKDIHRLLHYAQVQEVPQECKPILPAAV